MFGFTIFRLGVKSIAKKLRRVENTGNDRYSGHGYSGIDRYSGTNPSDDAILFTVSGITAIVEQKFEIFGFLKLKVIKDLFYFA